MAEIIELKKYEDEFFFPNFCFGCHTRIGTTFNFFFHQINFEIFVGKLADHFEPIFIVIAPRTNEIID